MPQIYDPEVRESLRVRHEDNPTLFSRELQTEAASVDWLLRWEELARALRI